MKVAIVSARDLVALKRWDAHHVIECVELGGDIVAASRFVNAVRTKKGYGLLDLVDKARALGNGELPDEKSP